MEFDYMKIKVGDTVVRNDGLQGKVLHIVKDKDVFLGVDWETGNYGYYCCICGSAGGIMFDPIGDGKPLYFYRIGSQVIGDKVDADVLYAAIEKNRLERRQLSKQLWRLKNQMCPDWREKMAQKKERSDETKAALNAKYASVLDKLNPAEYKALRSYFAAMENAENGTDGDDDDAY